MAVRQLDDKPIEKEKISNPCPKCGGETLDIDVEGMIVRWMTCPKCKFKKLVEKEDKKTVKVTPL
ncbi:MAG: hypothetical protein ACXACX_15660 [Candidatus Hodarchaeales archaeon]|jgi:Zn finger protein HypA/HybF involved in hydrogenase expression